MNDPYSVTTNGTTTDNIVCKFRRGTIKVVMKLRQLWNSGYQPTQPAIELMCTMLFKVVLVNSELSALREDAEHSTFLYPNFVNNFLFLLLWHTF